jgi:hypothetical protein
MKQRVLFVVLFALIAGTVAAGVRIAGNESSDHKEGLTVHEWGTFTTVAGPDGQPADWLPLSGPADLPCFVEHFDNNPLAKIVPEYGATLSYAEAKSRLNGKVRMETPVLYFYAPREQRVNVAVEFPRGIITEWYPHAGVMQLGMQEKTPAADALGSRIEWKDVRVMQNASPQLPLEAAPSHYYAARNTDASPVRVGAQDEKFLFYRGIGNFGVPVTAQVTPAGAVRVENTGAESLPALVLFVNRDGRIGYSIRRNFQGRTTLDLPGLDGNFAALQGELEKILTESGLYPKEARAMIATWRDSWFDEGVRVFYLVPGPAVNRILPLKVEPSPASAVRTFVGRVEVITPAMVEAVENDIAANNVPSLAARGRFLGPIADRILAKGVPDARAVRIRGVVDAAYKSVVRKTSQTCR